MEKKQLIKKLIFISSLVFVLSLVAKYVIFYISKSEYANYEFLSLTLIKIALIVITIYCLNTYKPFSKNFYLKNNTYYLLINTALILFFVFSTTQDLNIIDQHNHSFFLTYYLAVGIFEELFFRLLIFGFLHKLLTRKNEFQIIIITSIFFALFHSLNFFDPNFIKISVLNQIIYAFGLGLIFQSILIKTNNILFVSILHGILNYKMMFETEFLRVKVNPDDSFSSESFFQTFISLLLFVFIIAIPISYLSSNNLSKKFLNKSWN